MSLKSGVVERVHKPLLASKLLNGTADRLRKTYNAFGFERLRVSSAPAPLND